MTNLFSPITIKNKYIKNRLLFPAMVSVDCGSKENLVTAAHLAHYQKLASENIGMIVSEALCVNNQGKLAKKQILISDDQYVDAFKPLVAAVHQHQAVFLAQLHHAGIKTIVTNNEPIVAPSDYHALSAITQQEVNARALTIEEIHNLEEDFFQAARRSKDAGFDGIELHGAHGYLISQFISPYINHRTDEYGGSVENRCRFGEEIITKIKQELGQDFIISMRMGCFDPDLASSLQVAKRMEHAGVDMLNLSFGMAGLADLPKEQCPSVPRDFPYNWIVYCSTEIKKQLAIPVAVVNDIQTPARANYLLEQDLADFTAVCRGVLVEDNWLAKAETGAAVNPCLNCQPRCYWYTKPEKCPGRKKLALQKQ